MFQCFSGMEDSVSYSATSGRINSARRERRNSGSTASLQKDMKLYVCRHNRNVTHAPRGRHVHETRRRLGFFPRGGGPEKASRDPNFKAVRESRNPAAVHSALSVFSTPCSVLSQGTAHGASERQKERENLSSHALCLSPSRGRVYLVKQTDRVFWLSSDSGER